MIGCQCLKRHDCLGKDYAAIVCRTCGVFSHIAIGLLFSTVQFDSPFRYRFSQFQLVVSVTHVVPFIFEVPVVGNASRGPSLVAVPHWQLCVCV